MFKTIPASDISQRHFNVYKEWSVNNTTIPVIRASSETGLFDLSTSTNVNGIYTHPLYHSIKAKYYSSKGNTITQYGDMKNPADWAIERSIGSEIYIIQLPQSQYGEQIKNGSVVLTIDGIEYLDNGFGSIVNKNPTYEFISYDIDTQIITFTDGTENYEVVVSQIDLNTGIAVFTIDGDTVTNYVTQIDFETGLMVLSDPLLFSNEDVESNKRGNIFYDDGLLVLTNIIDFTQYTLKYRSTQKIYETEILVSANKGEFNASQNPTAVDVIVENSYDFELTEIPPHIPSRTIKIKEIQDIKQKQKFIGSVSPQVSGSWEDYYEYGTTDPTGSYISTYITTIGLYDEQRNMVAVAKLPKPIKKLPDYNLNFLVRFDT